MAGGGGLAARWIKEPAKLEANACVQDGSWNFEATEAAKEACGQWGQIWRSEAQRQQRGGLAE
eukprot:3129787-Alexandrium_andersonii.AAC.1